MNNKKNIRKSFIQGLMEDKKEMAQTVKEATQETINAMLGDHVKKAINEAINANRYTVENVNMDDPNTQTLTDSAETNVEECNGKECGGKAIKECGVADLKQYLNEDGEYDLSTVEDDDERNRLIGMIAKDGDANFRVFKDGDSITISDGEENELILDIDDIEAADDGDELTGKEEDDEIEMEVEPDEEETEFEMEVDDEPAKDDDDDTEVVIATDSELDDIDDDEDYEIDTDEEEVEEPADDEENLDEISVHASAMPFHNADEDGKGIVGRTTMKNKIKSGAKEDVNENIKKKLNALMTENKELQAMSKKLNEWCKELALINASYGQIIGILAENSTSREEKTDIISRFSKVSSINECKELGDKIRKELNSTRSYAKNGEQVFESRKPLNESVQKAVSDDSFSKVKDLMDRVNAMK